MSGLGVTGITLLDIIIKLGRISERFRNAPIELNGYISELRTLYDISGAIQQSTKNLDGLNDFTIKHEGKDKSLLEYCHDHLEKVIYEVNTTLLANYGQNGNPRVKKWWRRGRFSIEKSLIQDLLQSVKDARSMLQIALSAAALCRDQAQIEKLRKDFRDMCDKTIMGGRNIGQDVERTFREHAREMESCFVQQKDAIQSSLDGYRAELEKQSQSLQQSYAANNAVSSDPEPVAMPQQSSTTPSQGMLDTSYYGGPPGSLDATIPHSHRQYQATNGQDKEMWRPGEVSTPEMTEITLHCRSLRDDKLAFGSGRDYLYGQDYESATEYYDVLAPRWSPADSSRKNQMPPLLLYGFCVTKVLKGKEDKKYYYDDNENWHKRNDEEDEKEELVLVLGKCDKVWPACGHVNVYIHDAYFSMLGSRGGQYTRWYQAWEDTDGKFHPEGYSKSPYQTKVADGWKAEYKD